MRELCSFRHYSYYYRVIAVFSVLTGRIRRRAVRHPGPVHAFDRGPEHPPPGNGLPAQRTLESDAAQDLHGSRAGDMALADAGKARPRRTVPLMPPSRRPGAFHEHPALEPRLHPSRPVRKSADGRFVWVRDKKAHRYRPEEQSVPNRVIIMSISLYIMII